ncbi:MAG: Verru_Chthon cassette protein A [Chthoniobacteraceae bacterium]
MNHTANPSLRQPSARRGIALVITLLLLLLLSAFAVAFFTRMSVEQVSAASYSDGVTSRQLAESVVGLVQSQIREGTTVPNGAWASQPGMIRTFAKGTVPTTTPSNRAYGYYKLYSSADMTVSKENANAFDPAKEFDADWPKQTALWTDLNEPVTLKLTDPANKANETIIKRYPIFDPALAARSDSSNPSRLSIHDTNQSFKVEGFSLDADNGVTDETLANMPVRWLYVLRDGTLTAPTMSADDGRTAVWEAAGTGNTTVPTKANPIVGRVAFWTDDDTSKVNLNTAGGFTTKDIDKAGYDTDVKKKNYAGSYWDAPRFFTMFDRGGALDDTKFGIFKPGEGSLALSQPPSNEFQRYPGHPFTTSLGLVFSNPGNALDPARLTSEQLYRVLPRLQPGGTKGGSDRHLAWKAYSSTSSDDKLPLKSERLFTSVDEFFFSIANPATNSNQRQPSNAFLKTAGTNWFNQPIPAMTEDLLKQSDLDAIESYRFFLTAHSQAPELNLYGRPRVSIWPTWAIGQSDATNKDYSLRRNPLENLLVFCSTLGPLPKPSAAGAPQVGQLFMFQRYNPYESATDAGIDRNRKLLTEYLSGGTGNRAGLTDQPVPGFTETETFAKKYNGAENKGSRDQILVEIFDYIRSGVNIRDTYFDKDPAINPSGLPYNNAAAAPYRLAMDRTRFAPRGVVVPAAIKFPSSTVLNPGGNDLTGFGRFPTVSEVSIVFYHAGYRDRQGIAYWDPSEKTTRGVTSHLMRMFLVVETFNPMQGYCRPEDTSADDRNLRPFRLIHAMEVRVPPRVSVRDTQGQPTGLQTFTFNGGGTLRNEIRIRSGAFTSGSDAAGMEGILHGFGRKFVDPAGPPSADGVANPNVAPPPYPASVGQTDIASSPGDGEYPFQSSNVIEVPIIRTTGRQTNFTFEGMEATLQVLFGDQPLQRINLVFPRAQDIPLPSDAYWEDPGGFAWPNQLVQPNPTIFNTAWQGRGTDPWSAALITKRGSTIPCYPAAMKSLAYRIWWVNECWALSGRAYQGNPYGKFDIKGKELFDNAARGFSFNNKWRNIIQSGDVVRSLVPRPKDNNLDTRIVALTRYTTRGGETLDFEPLKPDYDSQTVRHVQRLDTAGQAGPLIQTQLLRAGSGTPFIFSGTESLDASGRISLTPGTAGAVSTTAACSIEPTALDGRFIGNTSNQQFAWERKSYGVAGSKLAFGNLADLSSTSLGVGAYGTRAADLPAKIEGTLVNGVKRRDGFPGDFDTGIGSYPDGALCNKPDEGHLIWRVDRSDDDHTANPDVSNDWWYRYPYYISEYNDEAADAFFSPSRQVPSPVMFGSLLVGVKSAWQTLCFSPNPASLTSRTVKGKADHPGFDTSPKDHLLLDLFTMPVIEPYAISEPFSTAGKVNLNCEIMPFKYIRRTTALRAALQSVRITAVPPSRLRVGTVSGAYKLGSPSGTPLADNYRLALNRDETIKSIVSLFDDPDLADRSYERFYKSASQICERFLYPKLDETDKQLFGGGTEPKWNRSDTDIRQFWERNNLGGDNTREKPYADLYSRLTTKSNTFTVHMRVQKLRPQRGLKDEDFLKWTEKDDSISAEYRGESQIERYLDPQDRRFSDEIVDDKFKVDAPMYIPTNTQTRPLEFAYRFRVVGSKRFAPDR